jgi:hypothetical protein
MVGRSEPEIFKKDHPSAAEAVRCQHKAVAPTIELSQTLFKQLFCGKWEEPFFYF